MRVLDVACGPGHLSAAAARRGAHPVGIDLSDGMLAQARRANPGLEFRSGDAEQLPFADGAFRCRLRRLRLQPPTQPGARRGRGGPGGEIGGTVAISVWDHPERTRLIGLLGDAIEAAGADRDAGRPPGPDSFRFATDSELARLLSGAGLDDVRVGDDHPVGARRRTPKSCGRACSGDPCARRAPCWPSRRSSRLACAWRSMSWRRPSSSPAAVWRCPRWSSSARDGGRETPAPSCGPRSSRGPSSPSRPRISRALASTRACRGARHGRAARRDRAADLGVVVGAGHARGVHSRRVRRRCGGVARAGGRRRHAGAPAPLHLRRDGDGISGHWIYAAPPRTPPARRPRPPMSRPRAPRSSRAWARFEHCGR